MKKKIMNSLLHIGAGIMLSVFIYKCGELLFYSHDQKKIHYYYHQHD